MVLKKSFMYKLHRIKNSYKIRRYHDLIGLRKLLNCYDLQTNSAHSFLFQKKDSAQLVWDHRQGKTLNKPILVISFPRSGTHLLSNILNGFGLFRVSVSLDHLETYCFRLDESHRLIHQMPTGVPLFKSCQMFLSGQFSTSHMLYSDWVGQNIKEHFTVITLERKENDLLKFVISDLIGRVYEEIRSGVDLYSLIDSIEVGDFDDQIIFLINEFNLQCESLTNYNKISDLHLYFEDLLSDQYSTSEKIRILLGLRSGLYNKFNYAIKYKIALYKPSFTKRKIGLLNNNIIDAVKCRVTFVLQKYSLIH
jgi:hypothetical protein